MDYTRCTSAVGSISPFRGHNGCTAASGEHDVSQSPPDQSSPSTDDALKPEHSVQPQEACKPVPGHGKKQQTRASNMFMPRASFLNHRPSRRSVSMRSSLVQPQLLGYNSQAEAYERLGKYCRKSRARACGETKLRPSRISILLPTSLSGWEKSKKHVTAAFLASISSGIDSGRTAGTLDMHADAVRKDRDEEREQTIGAIMKERQARKTSIMRRVEAVTAGEADWGCNLGEDLGPLAHRIRPRKITPVWERLAHNKPRPRAPPKVVKLSFFRANFPELTARQRARVDAEMEKTMLNFMGSPQAMSAEEQETPHEQAHAASASGSGGATAAGAAGAADVHSRLAPAEGARDGARNAALGSGSNGAATSVSGAAVRRWSQMGRKSRLQAVITSVLGEQQGPRPRGGAHHARQQGGQVYRRMATGGAPKAQQAQQAPLPKRRQKAKVGAAGAAVVLGPWQAQLGRLSSLGSGVDRVEEGACCRSIWVRKSTFGARNAERMGKLLGLGSRLDAFLASIGSKGMEAGGGSPAGGGAGDGMRREENGGPQAAPVGQPGGVSDGRERGLQMELRSDIKEYGSDDSGAESGEDEEAVMEEDAFVSLPPSLRPCEASLTDPKDHHRHSHHQQQRQQVNGHNEQHSSLPLKSGTSRSCAPDIKSKREPESAPQHAHSKYTPAGENAIALTVDAEGQRALLTSSSSSSSSSSAAAAAAAAAKTTFKAEVAEVGKCSMLPRQSQASSNESSVNRGMSQGTNRGRRSSGSSSSSSSSRGSNMAGTEGLGMSSLDTMQQQQQQQQQQERRSSPPVLRRSLTWTCSIPADQAGSQAARNCRAAGSSLPSSPASLRSGTAACVGQLTASRCAPLWLRVSPSGTTRHCTGSSSSPGLASKLASGSSSNSSSGIKGRTRFANLGSGAVSASMPGCAPPSPSCTPQHIAWAGSKGANSSSSGGGSTGSKHIARAGSEGTNSSSTSSTGSKHGGAGMHDLALSARSGGARGIGAHTAPNGSAAAAEVKAGGSTGRAGSHAPGLGAGGAAAGARGCLSCTAASPGTCPRLAPVPLASPVTPVAALGGAASKDRLNRSRISGVRAVGSGMLPRLPESSASAGCAAAHETLEAQKLRSYLYGNGSTGGGGGCSSASMQGRTGRASMQGWAGSAAHRGPRPSHSSNFAGSGTYHQAWPLYSRPVVGVVQPRLPTPLSNKSHQPVLPCLPASSHLSFKNHQGLFQPGHAYPAIQSLNGGSRGGLGKMTAGFDWNSFNKRRTGYVGERV